MQLEVLTNSKTNNGLDIIYKWCSFSLAAGGCRRGLTCTKSLLYLTPNGGVSGLSLSSMTLTSGFMSMSLWWSYDSLTSSSYNKTHRKLFEHW